MTYTSIFGQDLTDYAIQILVDNGVGEGQWQEAIRRERELLAFTNNNAPEHLQKQAFVSAGIIGSALTAAWQVFTMTSERGERERGGNLRGRSFINLRWESQARGFVLA